MSRLKKGLSSEGTWDPDGNFCLKVRKERGKLTLEDIRQAAMDYEEDYYFLVMKCMNEDMAQYFDDDLQGDVAELYCATDVLEAYKRLKKL